MACNLSAHRDNLTLSTKMSTHMTSVHSGMSSKEYVELLPPSDKVPRKCIDESRYSQKVSARHKITATSDKRKIGRLSQ